MFRAENDLILNPIEWKMKTKNDVKKNLIFEALALKSEMLKIKIQTINKEIQRMKFNLIE